MNRCRCSSWPPKPATDQPSSVGAPPVRDRRLAVCRSVGLSRTGCAPPRDFLARYNSRMQIGPYRIDPPVVLAPMAGVTDKPFRLLCKRLGAGLAVSEMTTADPRLWQTRKSRQRMDHVGEPEPISVQIAGYDPAMLAEAARFNAANGAQII